MSLKKDWWCIGTECKHYNTHTVHKGSVKVIRYCKHKASVKSKKCDNAELGRDIDTMIMCPVLYDMKEEDEWEVKILKN